jgi:hypothetical protein
MNQEHRRFPSPNGVVGNQHSLARYIRERTRNGAVLVDFALQIMRGKAILDPSAGSTATGMPRMFLRPRREDRLWALRFLTEHGFGRPGRTPDVDVNEPTVPQDLVEQRAFLRSLTDEELAFLHQIAKKRQAARAEIAMPYERNNGNDKTA